MGNSMSEIDELKQEIQRKGNYWFRNKELLNQALTHDSLRVNDHTLPTYQRLEFLGDSVLQLVISEYLMKKYPLYSEGRMTEERQNFVSNSKLRKIAGDLGMDAYVKFADSVTHQRPNIRFNGYENFIESLIGAIYVDAGYGLNGGLAASKAFIYRVYNIKD